MALMILSLLHYFRKLLLLYKSGIERFTPYAKKE